MTWQEKVIGSNRLADPDHGRAGTYGFFEKRVKQRSLTVIARVYPDFGSKTADEPHLWGVVFPEQKRLTEFDPKTGGAKETRPYARERRFGAKAATRKLAQRDADECIARGGWDGIERNDNGTLKSPYSQAVESEIDDAERDVYDDVPEEELT